MFRRNQFENEPPISKNHFFSRHFCGYFFQPIRKSGSAISLSRVTLSRFFSEQCSKCWLVVIPILVLNAVLTIDSLLAQNNEKIYSVTLHNDVLVALGIQQENDERLSETLRAHWVAANKDGNLEGRITAIEPSQSSLVPIEQLEVSLLQKGQDKYTATTDSEGKFQLNDVEPGVYTLVAAGQNGFLAYGVHVLPSLAVFDVLEQDSEFHPKSDNLADKKRAIYVTHFGLPDDAVVEEGIQIDAAAVPPEFTTLERISQNYLSAADALTLGRDTKDFKAIKKSVNIRHGFRFPLAEDGSFNGRIQPIATEDGRLTKLREMNLFLIQDDLEVARVSVEENGMFTVENVEPGVYSLVAAGTDGFAALSVELVADTPGSIGEEESAPAMNLDGELNTDDSRKGSSSITHNVSTHPQPERAVNTAPRKAVPLLGVGIVSDSDDIQAIKRRIKQIADLRRDLLNRAALLGNGAPINPVGGGMSGFAPNGLSPNNFGASGGSGFPSGFSNQIGNPRLRLLFAGLVGGAVAIGTSRDSDPSDPPPISPNRVVIASSGFNSQ